MSDEHTSAVKQELKRSPFAETPLRSAILKALEKPTVAHIKEVARMAASDRRTARREIRPKPSHALAWFMRHARHEPTCNIHTKERPLTGCSCPFGPCYAVLSKLVDKR